MSDIKDKLIPVNLEQEMKKSFISYAMAVIIDRALPDVRDGLKPVHRRILYDMNELGMTPDKPYRKSARVVGDVLGKYHPHGDSSVYDAMVRLAQPFNIRYPLVDGQGNYGSVDGDGAAAMRYTEARMQKLTMHLLDGIDKDTVDFYPNFDETLMQPAVLPARFPNLLVNGSNGIAVGMATNIPPHNLREVIDGVICMIDKPDCTIEDLMQHIKGPDFPTGGIILGRAGIRETYYTGHGRITVRARTTVEERPGGRSAIIVTEIPYQVNKAVLVKKIADLVHEKQLDGIADIQDLSNDREGMRVVIDLKRDAYPQVVLNYLYKHTAMQQNFGANMLALVDGKPRVLNLRELIYYYLEHQKEVVTRRTRYDLDKAQARAHILEGLIRALDHIDEIVDLIKSSPDTPTAKTALMERFAFSDRQAQAILDMRLARLTGLERDRLMAEYQELEKTIARLTAILADEHLLMEVIKTEITEIRDKFSDERRTELSVVEGEIDVEDLIAEEDMVVTLTRAGYVKRIAAATYRAQRRGGRGVTAMTTREEDYATQVCVVNTHAEIMFFTNRGRVFSLKCYQIPEAGRTARGTAIVNLLQVTADERVSTMLPMPREGRDFNLLFGTRLGMVKKTPLDEFRNLRKMGLIAINLREEDEVVGVRLTTGEDELILGSRQGMCIRFSEKHVRPMGRNATGVRAIRLDAGDEVIDLAVLEEDCDVLAITALGFGKRTSPEAYREQGRNGKGIKAMKLTERTGVMTALLLVHPDEDLLLITDGGTIIRSAVDSIRVTGRNASGVKLIRLAEGSRVIGVARAEKNEEEPAPAAPVEPAEAEEAPAEAEEALTPADDLDMEIQEPEDEGRDDDLRP
ncbi:MAG: DNA gyrase subunit A [Clostridia bacterium]|nr:DNA gyrase subunit A [Clostridia bacterium]